MLQWWRGLFAKPEKSAAEIADDNERTNSMGLFNTAEAYRNAAQDLAAVQRRQGFAERPVETCFLIAAELYLKSFLRQHYEVAALEKKFRHDFRKMRKKSARHGLKIAQADRELMALLTEDYIQRRRYLRTGPVFGNPPSAAALDRLCENLRRDVGAQLRKAGVNVRIDRKSVV